MRPVDETPPRLVELLRAHDIAAASATHTLHHQVTIAASAALVFAALSDLTLRDLPVTRGLSVVRYLRPGVVRADRPLLSHGPLPLVHTAAPHLVVAAGASQPWRLHPARRDAQSLTDWARFDAADWVKILLAFTVEDQGEARCRLSSDTLVWPTSRRARYRFGPYWAFIRPFASLLRVEILTTTARQSERGSHS